MCRRWHYRQRSFKKAPSADGQHCFQEQTVSIHVLFNHLCVSSRVFAHENWWLCFSPPVHCWHCRTSGKKSSTWRCLQLLGTQTWAFWHRFAQDHSCQRSLKLFNIGPHANHVVRRLFQSNISFVGFWGLLGCQHLHWSQSSTEFTTNPHSGGLFSFWSWISIWTFSAQEYLRIDLQERVRADPWEHGCPQYTRWSIQFFKILKFCWRCLRLMSAFFKFQDRQPRSYFCTWEIQAGYLYHLTSKSLDYQGL